MIESLIHTSLLWCLFLFVYIVLLRNETYFVTNRFYLVGTLLLGLLIPQISFAPINVEPSQVYLYQPAHSLESFQKEVSTALPTINDYSVSTAKAGNNITLFKLFYLSVSFLMVLRLLIGYRRLRSIKGTVVGLLGEKIKIIAHNHPHGPFSFASTIYINDALLESPDYDSIINHEYEHLYQKHWVDIAISAALKVILWWHPCIYLYEKLIKENHEYLADDKASTVNPLDDYIALLCGQTTQPFSYPLTHNFITSSLKKRIDMLLRKRTSTYGLIKYCALIPVLCLLTLMFSCQTKINYDSYEVGAAVDKVINKNYFKLASKATLKVSYNKLKEKYPTHLPYIQKRLANHFESIGGSLSFTGEENFNFNFSNGLDEIAPHVIRAYPSIRPLRDSDLLPSSSFGDIMTSEPEEHKAIDFASAIGTPIYASGDGYVEKVIKSDKEYGQTILLRYGAFVESYYAHLSEILVEEGDFVEIGSIIGKVGEVDHRSGSLFAQTLE